MSNQPRTTQRLALHYCDDTFGILRADETVEDALQQARECDAGETDPANLTRVFRVIVLEVEEIVRPDAAPTAQASIRIPA